MNGNRMLTLKSVGAILDFVRHASEIAITNDRYNEGFSWTPGPSL